MEKRQHVIKLFGVPSCNKIRDARELFEKNKIVYQFVNVKKTPVSELQLKEIVNQLSLDRVINKQGLTYKKFGLSKMNLNEDELFQWIFREQGMIRRPLIENNGRYLIDTDENKIIEFCKH